MPKIQIAKNVGGRVVDRVKQGKANSSNVQKGKTCSFRGDMLISTLTGYKAIENINIGDFVLAKNEITGKLNYQSVTNKYSNQYDQSVYIEVWDNQGNQQTLVSNKIHPFFTKVNQANNPQPSSEGYVYQGNIANGAWVDAGNLQAGYQLLSENGDWQTIKQVTIADEPISAYNLTVNQDNTYFVSGIPNGKYQSFGVWVHNDCGLSLNNIKSSVAKDGRLHMDGNRIKNEILQIGYNKEALQAVKAILENSIRVRKSEKTKYGTLDKGHKQRIKIEQDALDKVNNMLKDLR